jgi:isoamylase
VRARAGQPYPLGATWDGLGVNFAVFSEHATAVSVCLFDAPGSRAESARIPLPEQTDMVWHGYVPGLRPGQLYGLRVEGPHDPHAGHRFNPAKVLLDPYAKAIGRTVRWGDENFGYRVGGPGEDLDGDDRDNAASAPLAAVLDTAFTWGEDRPPRTPWRESLIYELHVKGMTQRHPGVPEGLRGTYAGLATEPVLRHLTALGVTAVELMPVHHHVMDRHLVELGLSNYWGYSTLSYFAPDTRYSSAADPLDGVREFKSMVRALHAAGIEVILDVVYNHTAEGNQLGPTLSLRGIDNRSYYRLGHDARYYVDFTGCGNTLNMTHPRVLQLIMDSLRYWVLEMHVDGFRFDLASTLARELHDVDRLSAFFDIIHQDPVISQVKLIAEPWDLGHGGYQVGNFPVLWTEWNGRYRDAVRRYWRRDRGLVPELATRLAGSSDLYALSGRRPYASINFVTCHDGFTLQDLVSYERKHNEANLSDNTDGTDDNLSSNSGVEGPTEDPYVLTRRERLKRAFVATLLLSQGVPMIRGGDELSQTQRGNNNAYCQDNEVSWMDWDLGPAEHEFLAFVLEAARIRREFPMLRRRRFLLGRIPRGAHQKDVAWYAASGKEMTSEAWTNARMKSLGAVLLDEEALADEESAPAGEPRSILLLFNAHDHPVLFRLPAVRAGDRWERILDTAGPTARSRRVRAGYRYSLGATSVALFERIPGERKEESDAGSTQTPTPAP